MRLALIIVRNLLFMLLQAVRIIVCGAGCVAGGVVGVILGAFIVLPLSFIVRLICNWDSSIRDTVVITSLGFGAMLMFVAAFAADVPWLLLTGLPVFICSRCQGDSCNTFWEKLLTISFMGLALQAVEKVFHNNDD
jgi:uncharacterized membrane protein